MLQESIQGAQGESQSAAGKSTDSGEGSGQAANCRGETGELCWTEAAIRRRSRSLGRATGPLSQDVLPRAQPTARRDTLRAEGSPDWQRNSRIDREVMAGRVRPSGAARGIRRDRGPDSARSGDGAECGDPVNPLGAGPGRSGWRPSAGRAGFPWPGFRRVVAAGRPWPWPCARYSGPATPEAPGLRVRRGDPAKTEKPGWTQEISITRSACLPVKHWIARAPGRENRRSRKSHASRAAARPGAGGLQPGPLPRNHANPGVLARHARLEARRDRDAAHRRELGAAGGRTGQYMMSMGHRLPASCLFTASKSNRSGS